MSENPTPEPALGRRILLRGGAALAGAAGATVIGAAISPIAAQAADGDTVKVGKNHTGSSTTGLAMTGANSDPVLTLSSASGPALHLAPTGYTGELVPGDFIATPLGPVVGVDYSGTETTILATGKDLDALPLPIANTPTRLLDTRSSAGRAGIIRTSSSSAIDAQGHLTKNSWIDVIVASTETGAILSAAFLNVAALDPAANGYLTVYPSGNRPDVSTINFRTGVSLSNAAFVGLGEVVQEFYVVRIHTSQTAHVLLDLSGSVVGLDPYGAEGARKATTSVNRRTARQNARAAALRKSLRSI